jgi:HD superfamily phosphohydrolase
MKKYIGYYDNLYGFINIEKDYERILNDPFLMRLHNISQMGMTKYVYPDAVHTRFSHSLGVYYNISRMFLSQEEQSDISHVLNSGQKKLLKLTALLHDVGHVPLSHTVEQAMKRFHDQAAAADDSLTMTNTPPTEDAVDETQYEASDTKLHERLAEAILLGDTSLRKAVETMDFSCNKIACGIMGFEKELGFDELPSKSSDIYLKHAKNFMHSQLDADRIDYLIRDAAFSGVKAGAFDVEKLLAEIQYDSEANYGVDEAGIRALEQFFFARFGSYSQIVFNKKVHGLEYLAQEFYYQLLSAKYSDNNIIDEAKSKILSFIELCDGLRSGREECFLSFTDSVFYDLLSMASSGALFKLANDKLQKYARWLKGGVAPKVVGYEEYFATEKENKFHNSFFNYLRSPDNLKELSDRADVPLDDIILPPKPLSTTLIDTKRDFVCVFRDTRKVYDSLLDCDNSLLKLVQEKRLYVNRLFTFTEESQTKLKVACREMSKGFSRPGNF